MYKQRGCWCRCSMRCYVMLGPGYMHINQTVPISFVNVQYGWCPHLLRPLQVQSSMLAYMMKFRRMSQIRMSQIRVWKLKNFWNSNQLPWGFLPCPQGPNRWTWLKLAKRCCRRSSVSLYKKLEWSALRYSTKQTVDVCMLLALIKTALEIHINQECFLKIK